MLFLIGSFFAGMLTVLAPCVLPLLPIIIGGSLSGDVADKKRPVVIVAALATSLFIFTLLLKATTVLINIPPESINYISGAIIIVLGLLTLFPLVYARIIARLGIEHRAQETLSKGFRNKGSLRGPIIIGAALGPVFSSCSPVYGYILATVLPVNFAAAMVYILFYILGLSLVLLLIGFYGQRFIGKIKFASNPKGIFQRMIAVLFIVVGLLVMTGYDKKLQTYISENTPFNFDSLSAKLLPESDREQSEGVLNVVAYPSPEFSGLENWINSDALTLASQKGKVVLVDFWTYSCINCIRNNPYLNDFYQRYKDDGFVVVGVHAPEFAFERNVENVRKAVADQNISYPVALDNNFATWGAFKNQYWPAAYLIDAEGNVRRVHYGEGEYSETETAIRMLLRESGASVSEERVTSGTEEVPVSDSQTPETYMGTKQASNYVGTPALGAAPQSEFMFANSLQTNQWSLNGEWAVDSEKITAVSGAKLRFQIASKDVYVVASSVTDVAVRVLVNGKPAVESGIAGEDVAQDSSMLISGSKLYRILSGDTFADTVLLELEVPAGVSINAFTFGS